jgi:hypothetical protein
MRNRKRVVGKVLVTLVLALAGFAAAGVLSGVGLADMGTTMSTGTTTGTVPTTTTNPPPPPPPGGKGCTPGYWKQSQHFGSWTDPYDPSDPLASVFDAAALELHGLEDLTLLEALQANGGGANALIRHAVAAVLNAASEDVDFAFDVDTIVMNVNASEAAGLSEGPSPPTSAARLDFAACFVRLVVGVRASVERALPAAFDLRLLRIEGRVALHLLHGSVAVHPSSLARRVLQDRRPGRLARLDPRGRIGLLVGGFICVAAHDRDGVGAARLATAGCQQHEGGNQDEDAAHR